MEHSARLEELLDELVRLAALQARANAGSQSEAIRALGDIGFGPKRIAELLGTTPNTVNVALSKARRAKRQSGQPNQRT